MSWKLQHHHCLTALTLTLALAAACGSEDGSPPITTDTEGNQPGNGGAMSGSGGTGNTAAGGSMGGAPGASGMTGAGEAPGLGGAPIDMGAAGTDGNSGGAGGSPACATPGDTDGDGIEDCADGCPQNSDKIEPGVCGCDVRDTDTDFDGTLDCQENCDGDPLKLEPGACGCGLPDVDSDTDGTLDCDDPCAFDATQLEPGTCGCGAPDTLPFCLQHRYSFDGTGAVAADSVGDADGEILGGAALAGNGTLVLAGGVSDQYVNLPPRIISTLGPNATIETWVAWTGAGLPWQRIFDFGSNDGGVAGQQGPTGISYLFLTPSNTINTYLRLAFTNSGPPTERVVNALTPLPFPGEIHLAVVIDGAAQTIALYQGGNLIGTAQTLDTTLPLMNDVNNWLGRSQFALDEEFQGTLNEVRIYSAARSAAQIAADAAAGPNALQ